MQDRARQRDTGDPPDHDNDDDAVSADHEPLQASDDDGRREPELARLPSTVAHQPVSGVVAAIVAAVIMLVVGLYTVSRTPDLNEIPLLRATNAMIWLGGIVAILVAAVGTQFAEFSARAGAVALGLPSSGRGFPMAWVLPTAAATTAFLLIATWHNVWVAVTGALLTLVSVFVALLVRDLFEDLTDSAVRVATLVHGVMIHLVAFLGLAALYTNKLPAWLTALLVLVLSGLLIVEALGRAPLSDPRRIGFATLGGLVVAQSSIVIDRWPTWGWTGGIALLVSFFVANGILVTWASAGSIGRRDIGYYAGLGVAGLALIALFGR